MENLEPTKRYRQIGVRLWGEGAYERETITGAETQYQSFALLKADDIVVNKIWARNGSVSVIGEELSGCYGSPEFPIYEIDKSRLLPRFFYWFTKTKLLWDQCDLQSRGTSGQNRLKPERFLKIQIPLPSIEEQVEIARRLDKTSVRLEEIYALKSVLANERNALTIALIEGPKSSPYIRVPFGQVATLKKPDVLVNPNASYQFAGVYSFGRGVFKGPSKIGAEFSYERLSRINSNDFIYPKLMAWEGALGIVPPLFSGFYVSPEFPVFSLNSDVIYPEVIDAYFRHPSTWPNLKASSTGTNVRRRRLNPSDLQKHSVPIPPRAVQEQIRQLVRSSFETKEEESRKELRGLLPAILHSIFEQRAAESVPAATQDGTILALPRAESLFVDTPFKEAVLVGAVINAFHEEGGQPLGNFRLQKAVYFARRFMGESALDQQYLRKAAGPYNPSLRYSGGMKIALERNWIAVATGRFGPGSSPGTAFDDASVWIEKYQFAKTAAWVRDTFKFKHNDVWELLATVDYAMLALKHGGKAPNAANVFAYISSDEEWRPKIEKLRLSVASIQNAVVELQSLFEGVP